MDSPRIDRLARRLADGTSRRTVVQGILGGIAALAAYRGESAFAAPRGKVAVCHYDAEADAYTLISVNGNALDAHLAHGDYEANDCGEGPTCAGCFEPPAVCATGTTGVVDGDEWVVCRADATSAWLSANSFGVYNPLTACQSLGYSSVGAYGGTNGMVCGFDLLEESSCTDPGTEFFNGNTSDCGEGNICHTVHWRCDA